MDSSPISIFSIFLLVSINFNQVKTDREEIVLGMISKCEHDTINGPNIIATDISNTMSRLKIIIGQRPYYFTYYDADVCTYGDMLNTLVDLFTTEKFATKNQTKV